MYKIQDVVHTSRHFVPKSLQQLPLWWVMMQHKLLHVSGYAR